MTRSVTWLLLLLGFAFVTVSLHDAQVHAEVGPSESECRPYIEKAIHDLKSGDSGAVGEDDGSPETDAVDTGGPGGEDDGEDSTENAAVEQESQEAEVAADDDNDDDGDDNVTQEDEAAGADDDDDDGPSQEDEQVVAEDSGENNDEDDDAAAKSGEDDNDDDATNDEDGDGKDDDGDDDDDVKASAENQDDDDDDADDDGQDDQDDQDDHDGQDDGQDSGEATAEGDQQEDSQEDNKDVDDDDDQDDNDEDQASQEATADEDDGQDDEDDQKSGEATADQDDGDDDDDDNADDEQSQEAADEEEVEEQSAEVLSRGKRSAAVDDDDFDNDGIDDKVDEDDDNDGVKDREDDDDDNDGIKDKEDDDDDNDGIKDEDSKESADDDNEGDTQHHDDDDFDDDGLHNEVDDDDDNDGLKDHEDDDDDNDGLSDDEDDDDDNDGIKDENSKEETDDDDDADDNKDDAEDAEDDDDNDDENPEEELTLESEIPENRRNRDHIAELLHLDDESEVREKAIVRVADVILRDLKRIYENSIKPLETLYKYRDLSNRHFSDPEIFSKPLVLFMGPWSGGKSTLINYLTDNEFTEDSLRTGAEPSPAYFNILMHGEKPEVLDGTQLAADSTFAGLQKFGQGLEDRLRGQKLPSKLLEKVNIVEIPGILEVRKQVSRLFPFNDACQWFIDRADIIFLVYDPSKLDVGPETEAILDQLKGREYQTRIILNKADQVKPEELMRVQSALIWNISPLMSSAQPPVMYTTSLWSLPFESGAPVRLLQAQERALLRDLRSAIDKRIENKIASARRFAVRVRNHAKMVDCYLTTYYNHKSLFGNKKQISDQIIEHPQNYHIYEGLSTLTNISRYDLPDPEVYRDFFRLNPLYEFKKLSETCTYFRGCPINKLDVSIAYDLPELGGKYKKQLEQALAQLEDADDSKETTGKS